MRQIPRSILVLIFLFFLPFHVNGSPQTIEQVWSLQSDATSPPAFDQTLWKKTALPDYWDMTRKDFSGQAWYYATFNINQLDQSTWAIYLPRAVQVAEIYINGNVIGNSGQFSQPLSRNWMRPLLFNIPPSLLKKGDNNLYIRLAGYSNANSGLYGITIGEEADLSPIYKTRFHLQVTASQISTLLMVSIGLLAMILWSFRRADPAYFWLGMSSFAGAVTTSNWWLHEVPIDRVYWEAFWYSSFGWYTYSIVNFLHRFVGFGTRKSENAFVVYLLLGTATMLLVDDGLLVLVSNGLLAGHLIFSVYVLTTMLKARTQENSLDVYVLFVCFWMALLLATHDWLGDALEPPPIDLFVFYLSPIMVLIVILWVLISRHFRTLTEFENLTEDLQFRVEEKTAQLEKSHQQIVGLERIKAIDHERQRIMLDLHDGMGGYLVSALSITEVELGEDNALHDTLTLAMQDLRFMIDSMDAEEDDLITVLAMFRQRMEPILKSQGIALIWQVEEEPRLINFGPSQSLQVMRIVQEAVTNVVKHAEATEISIIIQRQAILIKDNGVGLQTDRAAGHGLGSMKQRASHMGGSVSLQSCADGITVRLCWD